MAQYFRPYRKKHEGAGFIYQVHVADGFVDDCEEIIQRCGKVETLTFTAFAEIWKEMNLGKLYHGRTMGAEVMELSEELIHIAKRFMTKDTGNFEDQVAGLFLVYGLVNLQPYAGMAPLRLVPEDVVAINQIDMIARKNRRLDVLYILGHLLIKGPVQYHAAEREHGMEISLRKYQEGLRGIDLQGVRPKGVFYRQNEELDMLAELKNVSKLYSSVKSVLKADKPDRNLSYADDNFYSDSYRKLKEVIQGDDGERRRREYVETEYQKRSNQVLEIKKKAMHHSVDSVKHLTGIHHNNGRVPRVNTCTALELGRRKNNNKDRKDSNVTDRQGSNKTDRKDSKKSDKKGNMCGSVDSSPPGSPRRSSLGSPKKSPRRKFPSLSPNEAVEISPKRASKTSPRLSTRISPKSTRKRKIRQPKSKSRFKKKKHIPSSSSSDSDSTSDFSLASDEDECDEEFEFGKSNSIEWDITKLRMLDEAEANQTNSENYQANGSTTEDTCNELPLLDAVPIVVPKDVWQAFENALVAQQIVPVEFAPDQSQELEEDMSNVPDDTFVEIELTPEPEANTSNDSNKDFEVAAVETKKRKRGRPPKKNKVSEDKISCKSQDDSCNNTLDDSYKNTRDDISKSTQEAISKNAQYETSKKTQDAKKKSDGTCEKSEDDIFKRPVSGRVLRTPSKVRDKSDLKKTNVITKFRKLGIDSVVAANNNNN